MAIYNVYSIIHHIKLHEQTKLTKQMKQPRQNTKDVFSIAGFQGRVCFQIPHPSDTGRNQTDQDFFICGWSNVAGHLRVELEKLKFGVQGCYSYQYV